MERRSWGIGELLVCAALLLMLAGLIAAIVLHSYLIALGIASSTHACE
jgi:hypothetical protein